jgi:hypothetical protein
VGGCDIEAGAQRVEFDACSHPDIEGDGGDHMHALLAGALDDEVDDTLVHQWRQAAPTISRGFHRSAWGQPGFGRFGEAAMVGFYDGSQRCRSAMGGALFRGLMKRADLAGELADQRRSQSAGLLG